MAANNTNATTTRKPATKRVTGADLIAFLSGEGYTFRMNEADDSLEVNGKPITDAKRAEIRERLRDKGYGRYLAAAEDSYLAEGARRCYHPVREYLQGLAWDGDWNIAKLTDHFTDSHGMFGVYLRHWLIGSVARAFTGSENRVLLLESKQGLGKSHFARWLCPLDGYYSESPLDPDNKDSELLALRSWIWELSEIAATTRRNDLEALKSFLTRRTFRLRPAYGHYEINKPGLCSFIGTANDSSGLIGDPTGSRRFLITTLESIDWGYTRLDVSQVWAEAMEAYRNGESPNLLPDEAQQAEAINAQYQFVDPVELLLHKHFPFADPQDLTIWTSTAGILTTLQAGGLGQNARANAMALAATTKRLGFQKKEQGKIKGYCGVR